MKKVLVVDSNADDAAGLCEILVGWGQPCVDVHSGRAGLAHLMQAPTDFSIIFMAIDLPEKESLSTVEWIRSSDIDPPAQLPIVAVLDAAAPSDPAPLRGAGFDCVLQKPLTAEKLHPVVAGRLRIRPQRSADTPTSMLPGTPIYVRRGETPG